MRRFAVLVFLAAAFGCSNEQAPSVTKDVQDIQSMSVRSDGLYDVRCRDGRAEVRSATEIRGGNVCVSGSGGNGSLICASRDNDGQNPWVIAMIDRSGNLTRIAGTTYATADDCHRALASARRAGNAVIACVSRDNDGQNPWAAVQIQLDTGAVNRLALSYATLDACVAGVNGASQYQDLLVLCASRDNDGQNPWIVSQIDRSGTLNRVTNLAYATVDQCHSAVSAARQSGDGVLICGSRDHDGQNPWNLYHLNSTGATMLALTYSTLDQCLQGP